MRDRCTKAHEYLFLLSKSERYFFNNEAIKEPAETATTLRPAGNKSHKYVTEYESIRDETHRTKAGLLATAGVIYETRNKRSVWTVPTKPYKEAHFATFHTELVRPCIRAGCPAGGIVLDPFGGSGTTGQVAVEEGRDFILCELNPDYVILAQDRTKTTYGLRMDV